MGEKAIKWPASITLMRHAVSAYNDLKRQWVGDPDYERFVTLYNTDFHNPETLRLARVIKSRYALGCSDADTPATKAGLEDALITGSRLHEVMELPTTIFVSPYKRTKQTLAAVIKGWPALGNVRIVEDPRLREQEHGLSTVYNNWMVFHAHHPEQKELYDLDGSFRYRYPQGENGYDVQDRGRDIFGTWIRDYRGERLFVVTHHLTILTVATLISRGGEQEFKDLDKHHKPVNCGLTQYVCDPDQGKEGKLIQRYYNRKLY
ncbi:MAG TPA: histidine phosphatase family protein [Patescibacteria group bacterium]